jgi:hypothetical protein
MVFDSPHALVGTLRDYDIVHLFCGVQPDGTIANLRGDSVTGTELLQYCCEADVKLLWIASDNQADRYISGFNARGKRINFVMTIQRNGSNFVEFLDKILFRMHHGDTMPVAWSDVCPQIPNNSNLDIPISIFWAGRGGVKLR